MMDFIKISGYKSFKEISLELKPVNILIGANGSGKSNFISFFEFLYNLCNQKLAAYVGSKGGEDIILHKGVKKTAELDFEISFNNNLNGYAATLRLGNRGFVFKNEFLIYQGDHKNISNHGMESNLKSTDMYRSSYIRDHLNSYLVYHFQDTGLNSPFANYSNKDKDTWYLYENGNNIAAMLYSIMQDDKVLYNRIVKNIQSIAPFFSDFFLKPNPEGYLKLYWQDKYSSTIYSSNDISDGTLRFIALTVLFMQPETPDTPSTIIIDEPELGLHPFAIAKLAGMIKSAAKRGIQVIVATQSADLVNYFDAEQIITIDQINGESQLNRLKSDQFSQWLDEYNIGELWQRSIISGGQPR